MVIEDVIKGFIELAQKVIGDLCLVMHDASNRILAYAYKGREVFLVLHAFALIFFVGFQPSEGFCKDFVSYPHKSARLLLK